MCANPEDCARFYECNFGHRMERTCPAGHNFDWSLDACNVDVMVQCPGQWPPGGDDGSPDLEPPGPPDGGGRVGGGGGNGYLPSSLTGQVHHAHATQYVIWSICALKAICGITSVRRYCTATNGQWLVI